MGSNYLPLTALALLILIVQTGCQSVPVREQAPLSCPNGFSDVALNLQHWNTEYSGFGKTEFSNDGELWMQPSSAHSAQTSHAALVLSTFSISADEFEIQVEYKNLSQLRGKKMNPWEVFWIFFQYRGLPGGEKETNYVVAKPNGIELGKAFSHDQQQFLKTVERPHAEFGKWQILRIQKAKSQIRVELDGELAFVWADAPGVSMSYQNDGQVGLYSEDAKVVVRRVCVSGIR